MPFKVTTWNINSVRLRIDLVARFLKSAQPDLLCLQETKCPDDAFPMSRLRTRRSQRTERLSRRRRSLARSVRADRRAEFLRQGRLPAHRRGAGRTRRFER